MVTTDSRSFSRRGTTNMSTPSSQSGWRISGTLLYHSWASLIVSNRRTATALSRGQYPSNTCTYTTVQHIVARPIPLQHLYLHNSATHCHAASSPPTLVPSQQCNTLSRGQYLSNTCTYTTAQHIVARPIPLQHLYLHNSATHCHAVNTPPTLVPTQ